MERANLINNIINNIERLVQNIIKLWQNIKKIKIQKRKNNI